MKKCLLCKVDFYKYQHKSRGGDMFCSYKCMHKHAIGKNKKNSRSTGNIHKRYKHNKSLDKKGTCYASFHTWLKRHYGIANRCEMTGCIYPRLGTKGIKLLKKPKKYEWSLKHGFIYSHNREAFWKLCQSCHRKYDKDKNSVI